MTRNRTSILAAALAAAFWSSGTAAQATAATPLRHEQAGVGTVSGGVGVDEAAAVRQLAPRYPLRIVFSRRDGAYHVADRLQVLRGGTPVAEFEAAGPWVLMDLPPGRYTLQADVAGRTLSREVGVASAGTTVHWVLPRSAD